MINARVSYAGGFYVTEFIAAPLRHLHKIDVLLCSWASLTC